MLDGRNRRIRRVGHVDEWPHRRRHEGTLAPLGQLDIFGASDAPVPQSAP